MVLTEVSLQEFDNGKLSDNTPLVSLRVYRIVTSRTAQGEPLSYEDRQFFESENIVVARRAITPDAMRDRFKFEERVAIKSSSDMRVQTFYDDLSLRKRLVNLDSPRFRLAMDLLLAEKLIAEGRDAQLLRNGDIEETFQ